MVANAKNNAEIPVSIIERSHGWRIINFKEIFECRDLMYFLVIRDVKSIYAQTIMGFSWAILQPLIEITLFTFIFGRIANVPTEGIPYVLFSSVALIPWTYLSQTMTYSSQSLINNQQMLTKIYFPRLIFPLISVFAKLVDFVIAMLIIAGVAIYYRVLPTWNLFLFPFMVIFMMVTVAGVGMWLSSLAIRFRDVKHAMPFVIRILMYSAPIVYSISSVPERYRLVYSLNPIVGIAEGFRATLLGLPIPWALVLPGLLVSFVLLVSGALYFKRTERLFVDVI
jgi:lipopolysaccharide transport system permease protein